MAVPRPGTRYSLPVVARSHDLVPVPGTSTRYRSPASSPSPPRMPSSMRALQIEREGRTRVVSLTAPEPSAGEVLIRIGTVGFCGSDLNSYRGLNPLVTYPRIPG